MAFTYDRPELPGKDDPEEVSAGEDFFPGVPGGGSDGGWSEIRLPGECDEVEGGATLESLLVASDYLEVVGSYNIESGKGRTPPVPYGYESGGFYYLFGCTNIGRYVAAFIGADDVTDDIIVRAYDANTEALWTWNGDVPWGSTYVRPVAGPDGTLYVGRMTASNTMRVMAIKDGALLWDSADIAVSGVPSVSSNRSVYMHHDGTRLWASVTGNILALSDADGSVLASTIWVYGSSLLDGVRVGGYGADVWVACRNTTDDLLYFRTVALSGATVALGAEVPVYNFEEDGQSALLMDILVDDGNLYFGLYDPAYANDDWVGRARVIKWDLGAGAVAWSNYYEAPGVGEIYGVNNLALSALGPIVGLETGSLDLPLAHLFDAETGAIIQSYMAAEPGNDFGWVVAIESEPVEGCMLYLHSIRPPQDGSPSDFVTDRRNVDGAVVWDTFVVGESYLDESLYSPIYSWPGYPSLSSTSRGVFHPTVNEYADEVAFFLISPTGESLGKALAVPDVDGGYWPWAVVEDQSGDHYSIYEMAGSGPVGGADIIVAGWNGIGTMKWAITSADAFDLGILPRTQSDPDEYGYYSSPIGVVMSPDHTQVIVAWQDNKLSAFAAADGSLLWVADPFPFPNGYTDNLDWPGYHSFVTSSDGSVFLATQKAGPTPGFAWDITVVAKLSAASPSAAPEIEWEVEWDGGTDTKITTVMAMDDGGVLAFGTRDADDRVVLRRYDADGGLVYDTDVPDPWRLNTEYGRALRVGEYVFAILFQPSPSVTRAIRRFSVATGELDEDGSEFPFSYEWSNTFAIGFAGYWSAPPPVATFTEGDGARTARDVFPNNAQAQAAEDVFPNNVQAQTAEDVFGGSVTSTASGAWGTGDVWGGGGSWL